MDLWHKLDSSFGAKPLVTPKLRAFDRLTRQSWFPIDVVFTLKLLGEQPINQDGEAINGFQTSCGTLIRHGVCSLTRGCNCGLQSDWTVTFIIISSAWRLLRANIHEDCQSSHTNHGTVNKWLPQNEDYLEAIAMDKRSFAVATISLALLLSLSLGLPSVSANPIFVPPIKVNSPESNRIYPTNQVTLNFTVTYAYHNYTGFSYSLDGKEPRETNQSSVLANLPSGSHKLIIYGNSSSEKYGSDHELLDIVYFSTSYSPALLTFGLMLTVCIATLTPLLFFGRKRIANRLKAEKRSSFWLGLLCFLFFTFLVFLPSLWHWTNDYLFPRFPSGIEISPLFNITLSVPFMCLGLFLMWFGTRRWKESPNKRNYKHIRNTTKSSWHAKVNSLAIVARRKGSQIIQSEPCWTSSTTERQGTASNS